MSMRYGKTAQNAIAAMSRLAQVYDGGQTRLSSTEIAEQRHLPRPLVAKLLSTLSLAGLVDGAPGRGGGYTLAKPPAQITLFDIVCQFELDAGESLQCPFGPQWCGNGPQCPLHEQLQAMRERLDQFLLTTTLEVFSPTRPQTVGLSIGQSPKPPAA